MIVGCYYTDLYCDGIDESNEEDKLRHQFPDQYGPVSDGGRRLMWRDGYTGETRAETLRKARRAGWKIVKDPEGDRAFCPGCVELGRHKNKEGTPG